MTLSLNFSDSNTPFSLWELIKVVNDTKEIFPAPSSSSGANITLLDNNTVQLNFWDSGINFLFILPILAKLVDPNVTRGLVQCSYLLSGQYNFLLKVLFYVACIIAVIGKKLT